jgi:hypothetical protein
MNIEYKINGLVANITGGYDYRYETILWLEKEKVSVEKNIYLIKSLEKKIIYIDELIIGFKKELSVLQNGNDLDIEEQIEDYDLAINTAYDIKSVYKSEIEYEFLNGEEEIDYDLIVLNQKKIDEIEKTIKNMENKRWDLQRISHLHNGNLPEFKEDRNFDKYLCACDPEDVSLDDDLSVFDDNFYFDEKYADYQAWMLEELLQ